MLLAHLSFSFGHGIAGPSVIATQWPKEQGQKDKQQNGQRKGTEGQATQWSKENDRRTGNTSPFLLAIAFLVLLSLFFWPLYCLSFYHFLLAIMLLAHLSFSFGHGIAGPSVIFFWAFC
jgi:hypothetical protein